ncbi:SgcJ/EcaC family oxidoreductase [uncultured Gimesia sp.]|uniref:YybH family protein n=1 Tax=uncultured Gimesia sp. TaxID=1678688 RepID=UPI0030DA6B31|tara:strand:- start:17616 stop:18587 length:972 start_codon:yes stop_codon:yes gene_type:complete
MNLLLRQTCCGLTLPALLMLIVFDSSVGYAQFQRTPLNVQTAPPAPSATPAAPQTSGATQTIKKMAVAFKEAFDQGNAQKVASFWAPEGEFIDASGKRLVGRATIQSAYDTFFKQNKNAKIQISVDSVRQIGENLAIEEGRTIVSVPEAAPESSQYTATHMKRNGQWRMVSVKESGISASGSHSRLKDLEWLIGTWIAEERGITLTTDYRWLPGNKFMDRTFYSSSNGSKKVIGKQIIGVDPISGDIMSWTFNTDGSHALGIWAPVENGWAIESRGVTSNGMVTSANNIISKIDDNGSRWQSVHRTANGTPLPDALEVVSKRK